MMASIISSLGFVIPLSLTLCPVAPNFIRISVTPHPNDLKALTQRKRNKVSAELLFYGNQKTMYFKVLQFKKQVVNSFFF